MIRVRGNGDKFLSTSERILWNFTYDVLAKFKVPIQFKVHDPDIPNKQNMVVQFFIPKGRKDIATYINHEFENKITESSEVDGQWMWGTDIQIFEYSGITPYMPRNIIEKLSKQVIDKVKQSVEQPTESTPEKPINKSSNEQAFIRKIIFSFSFIYLTCFCSSVVLLFLFSFFSYFLSCFFIQI